MEMGARRRPLPSFMDIKTLKKLNLPDAPGVYFFRSDKREILYIGKATSLRERVKSYFSKDIFLTRGPKIVQMLARARTVTFERTDSVLEALLLETALIKKHQPPYNTDSKDDKSYNCVVVTREEFPRVLLVRSKNLVQEFPEKARLHTFGPFPHGTELKEALRLARRIFPFRDKCAPRSGKPCFNRQISLCPGVCSGEITPREYKKVIRNLELFFEGKKSAVVKNLRREMKNLARAREFEKATMVRGTLFALEHIQDISLLRRRIEKGSGEGGSSFRIEAYDIAHLAGTNMAGTMVVVSDGRAEPASYRLFKIRSVSGPDDTRALAEVLERRLNHPEWRFPNLIVMDGGLAQRNTAERILKARDITIPVVSVVKNDRHKPERVEGPVALVREHERAILLANAEAHRFVISYHRRRRRLSS